ncbi:hypothetical protein IWW34DRAFT_913844 [Fusarium oxysporum f. sp. albedinis]|nr:hypothetical protein IWW34DRAFT_913844 [Fusarium oxysporum f. sp. albedinis]
MKLSISILTSFATVIVAAPIAMAGYDASLASYNSPEGIKSHHSPKTDTHLRPQYTKPKPKFYQPESAHPQKSKTPLHKMKRPKRDHKNPQSRPNPKPEQESHHKSHNVIPHQSQYAGPQKRKAYDTKHMHRRQGHRHAKSRYGERYYYQTRRRDLLATQEYRTSRKRVFCLGLR